ncbi:hypothetical protein DFO77_11972 [Marinilabilia salmonicolor]|uniref:Uncharacterized protein n=1 Tax=Marinilabilia salmonicolor TaxID=989 RepID=A0A2T0XPV0_9BACT|nr:hypothetical protein BY457_104185 [Marinilabilia salmonicolor]RCW31104.1 hypothetical protein DFO77_11972 [Marinilabilia salmonicolor]
MSFFLEKDVIFKNKPYLAPIKFLLNIYHEQRNSKIL